ncbi:YSIRK-type signal peptide-containing protein [Staphylococcus aureus]
MKSQNKYSIRRFSV